MLCRIAALSAALVIFASVADCKKKPPVYMYGTVQEFTETPSMVTSVWTGTRAARIYTITVSTGTGSLVFTKTIEGGSFFNQGVPAVTVNGGVRFRQDGKEWEIMDDRDKKHRVRLRNRIR